MKLIREALSENEPVIEADADYEAIARRDFERYIYEQCDEEDRERTA